MSFETVTVAHVNTNEKHSNWIERAINYSFEDSDCPQTRVVYFIPMYILRTFINIQQVYYTQDAAECPSDHEYFRIFLYLIIKNDIFFHHDAKKM